VVRGNYGQRIPRESAEIRKDTEEYQLLLAILEGVMKFIRANVSLILLSKQSDLTCSTDEA
jgi:hypothetical protein